MTLAILNVDWQTLADALALGGVYALMAVGIGLVFGVLRLVNFAYGQLIMAGAYALAFASDWGWPRWLSILFCFAVVLALSVLMDRLVFRPLRTQSPAVMLVATFAVAFLLQSIALLAFGPLGKIAVALAPLNRPVTIGSVDIRKIAIVTVVVTAVCLAGLQLLLTRTTVGLHMRAAAMDFRTARLLGVRANRVIGGAVLISGALAAVVAVMLTVQTPLVRYMELPDVIQPVAVTPPIRVLVMISSPTDYPSLDVEAEWKRLNESLADLISAGTIAIERLDDATLGGFAIGFASGLLGGALPTTQSQYLPSILFAAVILVLLVRPNGLFTRGRGAVERV